MTNFVFDKPNTVYLNEKEGCVTTPNLATIDYTFDGADVQLSIPGKWFLPEDIDVLIDFLLAAKEQLKKGFH